ncbi:WEB family protein At5g16730, chloroplastic-like [Harpegnathos saltator]|uniref:WEB family protein At5g16730, chloroplastic-like n=1 Tax=Harpegnathos saltator TaxID=610380 RepID=UPI000DBEEA00|nr:WEB family protein At5g16730, chloroplastic-like [Harpegnathos saltator]
MLLEVIDNVKKCKRVSPICFCDIASCYYNLRGKFADTEKTHPSTSSGGQFIDTLIGQWMKRTGTNIVLHQTENRVAENSNSQESKQVLQNQERSIQVLQRKLKQSQKAEISLSSALEMEMRNKEEIQIKLNATWESIDTIADYFNYISESLASFQQHRANLSNLYDNVILKQQENIQKLQSSNTMLKDLQKDIAQFENESQLQEKRFQEATIEQNKLRKQLEDSVCELQSQKNKLANVHAEEKLKLVKEQQRLLLEYENLQSRLQIIENEKCDITKSATQLQNKLLLQEEKTQAALTEQSKLRKQLENANNEFYMQKNTLISAYAEEKKKLIEEQQQFLSDCESLQSQLSILKQDNSNAAEAVVQKDTLISKLQKENSTYKNQIETLMTSNKEASDKYKALEEKQNMWEKESHTKTERIQSLEGVLNAMKQRETSFVNDINRIEKNLTNERDYSKNLESKLSGVKKDLHAAEMQNSEMQEALKSAKSANELINIELQHKLKVLQKKKEEVAEREDMWTKNAEILHENTRAKHAEEVSALTNSYEARLLELRKTIERLNETSNNITQENSALKTSLTEMREENISLKSNYQFTMERNENLQNKLKEATDAMQMNIQESKKNFLKDKKQTEAKSEFALRSEPEIMEMLEADQSNVSTSMNLGSQISDLGDNEYGRSLSQRRNRTYSIERESPKEQEKEVTSAGKKFFKSRQLRTYLKRR